MTINAIIFGSTGMIGQGLVLECLENPQVESILLINRQPCGMSHKKLKEIIHQDFFDLSSIENEFKNKNTCFFCLGISAVGLDEPAYDKITFDLTINVAKTLLKINPDHTFCYVSGAGTDSSEKGNAMWARVKGKTENALLAMPFKKSYMFRPGYIQPTRGIKSKTKWYNIVYIVFKPMYYLLKRFKNLVTDTDRMAKAMINAVAFGSDKKILGVREINILSRNSH